MQQEHFGDSKERNAWWRQQADGGTPAAASRRQNGRPARLASNAAHANGSKAATAMQRKLATARLQQQCSAAQADGSTAARASAAGAGQSKQGSTSGMNGCDSNRAPARQQQHGTGSMAAGAIGVVRLQEQALIARAARPPHLQSEATRLHDQQTGSAWRAICRAARHQRPRSVSSTNPSFGRQSCRRLQYQNMLSMR